MQVDFHYYATYCAALIAGYSHEEAQDIGYAAQHVDDFTRNYIRSMGGPEAAATTQSQSELMRFPTNASGRHDMTQLWTAFHFLPRDLYAECPRGRNNIYMHKYRLICGPNGELLKDTMKLAKDKDLQSVGVAMHVLADTWAHRYFAGTASLVINNCDGRIYEIVDEKGTREKVHFNYNPFSRDNAITKKYGKSIYSTSEHSTMNFGHGRIGHLPDFSFMRYEYYPAWNLGNPMVKDNPSEYYKAFSQMVYGLKYLRGDIPEFQTDTYADEEILPWDAEIREAIGRRQTLASKDWKAIGEKMSGKSLEDYDIYRYRKEFIDAAHKRETFLGKFIVSVRAQKKMIAEKIRESGNPHVGKKDVLFKTDIHSEKIWREQQ
ncbi:MAG: hypothetical protein HUJ73_02475 [Eubacterium sp.]|nr:hypothetical protein [Eubacterium sp.]